MILISFRLASSASIPSGILEDTVFSLSITQIMVDSTPSFWAIRYNPAMLNISNLLSRVFSDWNELGDFSNYQLYVEPWSVCQVSPRLCPDPACKYRRCFDPSNYLVYLCNPAIGYNCDTPLNQVFPFHAKK